MKGTKKRFALVLTLMLLLSMCFSAVSADAAVAPKSITLKSTSKYVDISGKVTVSVKSVKPAKAGKSVTWKSSNKKIATVSAKGVVTGKKAGTVKITAVSKLNKKVKGTIKLTVKDYKVTGIKLDKTTAKINKGAKLTLKSTVSAAAYVYKGGVKWTSSDSSVKVANGVVTTTGYTGMKNPVTITASKDGKKASCRITIIAPAAKATAAEVKSYISDTDEKTVLVDARTADAYRGWALDGAEKGGHLENAVSFPAQAVTNAATPAKAEGTTAEDYWKKAMTAAGIAADRKLIIYDTNGKDANSISRFLQERGYSAANIKVFNVKSYIASNDTVITDGYELYVPAEVVKNISDFVVSKTELSSNARSIVGDGSSVKLLHAEYAANGKYTDTGYVADNPINWANGTVYSAGHVPGSVPISTDDFEPESQSENQLARDAMNGTWTASYELVSDEKLIELAEKYGISKDDTVILSGPEPMATTRIALILKYLGVDKVFVMSDALNGWKAKGYASETKINEPASGVSFGVSAPLNPDYILTTDQMKDKLADRANCQVVDARTQAEWNGEKSGYSYHDISGRIVGTKKGLTGINGYSSSMYYYRNADMSALTKEQLDQLWDEEGLDTGKQLIFFCGSGWRVSEVVWDAMASGYDSTAIWSDGWQGWSNDGNEFIDRNGNKAALNNVTNTVNNKDLTFDNDIVTIDGSGIVPANRLDDNVGEDLSYKVSYADKGLGINVTRKGVVTVTKAVKGKAVITAVSGKQQSSYVVMVTRSDYNYTNAETTYDKLGKSGYVILDARKASDYAAAHIPTAVSASVANDIDATYTDDGTAEENVKRAVDKFGKNVKYIVVCYTGNKYAAAMTSRLVEQGVSNDNIYTLGGDDKEVSTAGGMKAWTAKYPGYTVKSYTSTSDFAFNDGITADQANADMAGDNKFVYIDLRAAADRDAGFVGGTVSAPCKDVEDSVAEENLKGVIEANPDKAYVLICYTGNKFANIATTIMRDKLGVPESRIITLEGGNTELIKVGYNNITGAKLNANKSSYVVLDTRKLADYYDLHIKGSVSADVDGAVRTGATEASTAAAKENIRAAVEANGTDAAYAVVCYSGNKYAKKATGFLRECGVDNTKIFTLYKGFNQYKLDYSGDVEEDASIVETDASITIPVKLANNKNASMHYVVNKNGSQAGGSMFVSNVTVQNFYDALAGLQGAKPWRDNNMPVTNSDFNGKSIEEFLANPGVGNSDFSKLDITLSWKDDSGNTVNRTMAETLTGTTSDNFEMILANHKDNGAAASGCITCNTGCTFGICANSKVGWDKPFAANTANLPANGTVVYITYTLK